MTDKRAELLPDYRIYNEHLSGNNDFFAFGITVVFREPDFSRITLGAAGKNVKIPVNDRYSNKLSGNSSSALAFKLSNDHEVYVILNEQGADPKRKTTFAKALPVLEELAQLASAPDEYRADDRYSVFFGKFFSMPLGDSGIKRFPGMQDRDTFYGYLRTKPETSYNGINIKISHPVYCPVEGTSETSRLRKAEYLGMGHEDGDLVFFLIEDNAVYLSEEYDQRFGTFTGKESFEGDLELLNEEGVVLLKTKENFKSWQR